MCRIPRLYSIRTLFIVSRCRGKVKNSRISVHLVQLRDRYVVFDWNFDLSLQREVLRYKECGITLARNEPNINFFFLNLNSQESPIEKSHPACDQPRSFKKRLSARWNWPQTSTSISSITRLIFVSRSETVRINL